MLPIPVQAALPNAAGAASLPALIEQIGSAAFLPALLGVCHELAGASDLSVFTLHDEAPTLLGAVSLRGDAARRAGHHYLHQHFYRQDGNLRIAGGAARQLCLSHMHAAELDDPRYRETCYDSAGLRERISLLIPADAQWVFVNAYRPHGCVLPAERALERLLAQAPLLASAMRRHLALAPAAPQPRALAALSEREREVVEAILAGHSAKEAGRRLGLSPTSVATYRQRAFAKLGVKRQVELFRLLGGAALPH